MIIANSGPIISFARADYLDLLRATFKEITIPNAVFEDIVIGAEEVKEAFWIKRKEAKDKNKVEKLSEKLGEGESEAIVLAQERGATLLIDDSKARKEAEKIGVECIGTLRIFGISRRMISFRAEFLRSYLLVPHRFHRTHP
jgi:predicted nucleic acid-binding protein